MVRYERRPALSFLLGVPYPLLVLFVVVATGNHFLVDALAGAVVAGLATGFTLLLPIPTGFAGRV